MIHIISRRFCNPIFFSANNFSPFKTTIGRIEARNMATPSTAPAKEPAWHASLPAPRNSTPDSISRDELLEMFSKKDRSVKDFVLVDLRRTDYEVRASSLFSPPSSKLQSLEHNMLMPTDELTYLCTTGRYNPRLYQPTCAISVPYHSELVCDFCCGGCEEGGLVLW